MERKQVLIIGMLDSIHLARWLSQFEDQNIDFIIFPSKKFKYVNNDLLQLIKSKNPAKYTLARPYFYFKYVGFFEFGVNVFFKLIKIDFRKILLRLVFFKKKFTYVHAIEIQGAGYLYNTLPKKITELNNLILTNYGSDIYYYQNDLEHLMQIKSILKKTKYYSGECHRDYELVLKLGFSGEFLACIPNAGGFKHDVFELNMISSDKRNLIIAKCYGGIFGLGNLVIAALSEFLVNKPTIKVLLYSVTKDLSNHALLLQNNFPGQVMIHNINDRVPRTLFLRYFSEARIYMAASRSDGISTSFLEALCLGAFPIQTSTSCAQEWIDLGFEGNVVSPDSAQILLSLSENFSDPSLNAKRIKNLELAKINLSFDLLKNQALCFYGIEQIA